VDFPNQLMGTFVFFLLKEQRFYIDKINYNLEANSRLGVVNASLTMQCGTTLPRSVVREVM
jgi:hypothetical protein